MATDEAWGRALRDAKRDYEKRHDTDLTYKGMGERLGAILGRAPIPHPTVRSWFVDGQEPDTFQMVRALAAMLEVEPGTLFSGVGESVPPGSVDASGEPQAGQAVAPSGAPEVVDVRQLKDGDVVPISAFIPIGLPEDQAETEAAGSRRSRPSPARPPAPAKAVRESPPPAKPSGRGRSNRGR